MFPLAAAPIIMLHAALLVKISIERQKEQTTGSGKVNEESRPTKAGNLELNQNEEMLP